MTAFLELRDVSKVYGGGLLDRSRNVALDRLSLTLDTARPAITAVVGESGSGKTTLARLLLGLTEPSDGQVFYQGKDVHTLGHGGRKNFRRDVQAVFQDPYGVYNPFYRVDHVLNVPARNFAIAGSRAETRDKIDASLRSVGLRPEEILGRYPHQLSGGQRQRIMVARALLLRPKLIVADEPVSMVDASLRATILSSLRKLTDEFGISILYITHDLATAYQVSDNILVMYRANVVEAGAVEPVVRTPRHPYTQLLISAIPRVSTERNWGTGAIAARAVANDGTEQGCRFADRCPAVMAQCRTTTPALHRTEDRRAVSCHLHADAPELPEGDLASVLG